QTMATAASAWPACGVGKMEDMVDLRTVERDGACSRDGHEPERSHQKHRPSTIIRWYRPTPSYDGDTCRRPFLLEVDRREPRDGNRIRPRRQRAARTGLDRHPVRGWNDRHPHGGDMHAATLAVVRLRLHDDL